MNINYIQADCGAGKTYFTLKDIAANPGHYVFAVNKIDLIAERIQEFQAFPGSSAFRIYQCHTQNPLTSYGTIGAQIQTFPSRCSDAPGPVLLFVTHESLQITDWLEFTGWRLVIDEVPNVWTYIEGNFTQSHDYVQQFFNTEECEGVPGYLRLSLSSAGRNLRSNWKGDQIAAVLKPFLDSTAKKSLVMVNRDSWTKPDSRKLRGFALFKPEHLSVFQSVTILGNRFTDSLLHRCWSKQGVQFTSVVLPESRLPVLPMSDRLEIIYFSNLNASMNYFNSDERPLEQIAVWCRRHLGSRDGFYTTNEKYLPQFTISGWQRTGVMAHGYNNLKDKDVCVFMAALKGKPHEYPTIEEAFGVTREEFDLSREREALVQFFMRSNLRVYDSTRPVQVYVFSKEQAEFLHEITGAPIRHEDIGLTSSPNKGGRPRKDAQRKAA